MGRRCVTNSPDICSRLCGKAVSLPFTGAGSPATPCRFCCWPRSPRSRPPRLLRQLEHEFALAQELDPAWAARPLALVSHDGRRMLALEDAGGDPLQGMLGQPLELTQFLRLAIALAAALRQLHGRGLVHKDIKPENLLVDAARQRPLDRLRHRLPAAARAPGAVAAQVIAGTLRLHGAGADRPDESLDRCPQRSLLARRHLLRDADGRRCRSRPPIRWSGSIATSPGSRCPRASG